MEWFWEEKGVNTDSRDFGLSENGTTSNYNEEGLGGQARGEDQELSSGMSTLRCLSDKEREVSIRPLGMQVWSSGLRSRKIFEI